MALASLPGGDLIVGGYFVTVGPGVPANRIAQWDGAAWTALGSGLTGSALSSVLAIAVLPSGDLVVAGDFLLAGGAEASNIARWDGAAWSPLGLGINGPVQALAALPGGSGSDVVAAGNFSGAGGEPVTRIARWNGSTWAGLGSGTNAQINALLAMPNGDIIAAGSFNQAGSVWTFGVARWDGSAWHPMGTGIGGGNPALYMGALALLPSGDVIAGGGIYVNMASGLTTIVARWDGTSWTNLAQTMGGGGYVRSLAVLPSGDLAAGGDFTKIGSMTVNHIAIWNLNTEWSALEQGLNASAYALAPLANGELFAGGTFGAAGGAQAFHLARWGCPDEPCEADCDASGVLSIDDFICFQTFFVLGDAKADCDASGTLTIDDFVCFQTAFVLGC